MTSLLREAYRAMKKSARPTEDFFKELLVPITVLIAVQVALLRFTYQYGEKALFQLFTFLAWMSLLIFLLSFFLHLNDKHLSRTVKESEEKIRHEYKYEIKKDREGKPEERNLIEYIWKFRKKMDREHKIKRFFRVFTAILVFIDLILTTYFVALMFLVMPSP